MIPKMCYNSDMPTVLTYPIELHPAEDGGFCVTSPVLSIFTQGDTKEDALRNAEEAVLCHLEGLAKDKEVDPTVHIVMLKVEVPDTPVA